MKPKITFLFVMILAVILGGAGVIVYELGFANTMVEKLPKESVLANYLENETKATEAKSTDSVETTSPAQSAELIEPTEVTQTAKSSKKTKAEKVTTDSIETTEVQSGNTAKVDSRLFDASNKEMEKYYTIDLSERQIQRSDFYRYAPEEFSLIPFTEMDSVREGAKGWADALSLPLTADYIVVKDGKGLVTVDLTTWMEHFVPGFTPDHKLNGEEKLYLAMGRIMTDPATGIAYGKALNRTELYSGKTLGDLNPWLVEDFINKVDEHSYNDSGKWEPGERGIELWLRVRNSDNVVVTSEEYRAYATKICVLLSQLEFMENTNDSPKEHWHLMYAVSEDYDRLPERIETEETHTWAVYRSKVRKDGLIDFGLWINIGDARPGIPGAHPVPKETTPKVERGNGVEPEKTKEEKPKVDRGGDVEDDDKPEVERGGDIEDDDKPEVERGGDTEDDDKPNVEPVEEDDDTPETERVTPTPTPRPDPTPTPEPEDDDDIPDVEPQKNPEDIREEREGDQGTGQADIEQVEDESRFQPEEPVSIPQVEDNSSDEDDYPPEAIVNNTKDDCYEEGSEVRDDRLPAPEAVPAEERNTDYEPEIANQGTVTDTFDEDDLPFLD